MVPVMAPPTLIAAAAALLCAGFLRGFTGFGFGLAATPLLAIVLPPLQVVPVVLVLQVGSSFVHFRQTWRTFDPSSTWRIGLAAMAATPIGTLLLRVVAPAPARTVIALASLAALAVMLARRKSVVAIEKHDWTVVPVGLAAGVLGGLCAMPGPPVIAWYMARALPTASVRASMILIFLGTGFLALVTGTMAGVVTRMVLVEALAAAPLVLIGTVLGNLAFHRAPPSAYRLIGTASLVVIAIGASVRAIA